MSESKGLLESDVFNRTFTSGAEVGLRTYNAIIGLTLCWGFFVNMILIKNIDPMSIQAINPWIFFLGYFGSCFLGAYLFNTSDKPAVSFLGYNLVVVPFGLILNLVVSRYDPNLVLEALRITAGVTVVMMFLGFIYPGFFQSIHIALPLALLAMIIIQLVQIFVFHFVPAWTDWVVAIIFCGYIGYDWGRANRIPKTVDNAIDSAAALYMDIINLFVRILSLLGRRRN